MAPKTAIGRAVLCLLLLWLRVLLTSSASAPALSFDKMPPPRGADFSPAVMTAALSLPLQTARMTDPFGWRFHPLTGQLDFHYGLDLAADEGTAIYAVLSGTVRSASQGDSYGNYVILDHRNGFATLYAHCSRLLVQEGETVRKGQKIALVGSTGAATGPHLHFEMIQDGIRLDPLWALGDGERVTAIPEPEKFS
ncbi:MAG: M23 family metallopeptidase [Oscillospiraceae bacterium]|nr:M23 family metallopeptidase [Oscillospiraceae bacterium]